MSWLFSSHCIHIKYVRTSLHACVYTYIVHTSMYVGVSGPTRGAKKKQNQKGKEVALHLNHVLQSGSFYLVRLYRADWLPTYVHR